MRDDDWLTALDDGQDGPPRRRTWLLVAAVAPWLVVAVAAVTLRGPSERDGPTDPAPEEAAEQVDAAGGPDDADVDVAEVEAPAGAAPVPDRTTAELGEADGALADRAAAVATTVARAYVTAVEPRLVIEGVRPQPGGLYAEHLVVETVELPSGDDAAGMAGDGPGVVTLVAVVLDADDELRPTVRRLAVPVVVEQRRVRPAGRPWWLPGPELLPTVLATTPDHDPALAVEAATALAAGGLDDVEVVSVARSDGWPVVVTGLDGDGHEVEVWLREDDVGLTVAGMPTVDDAEAPR